ncbi:guanine nucleotide-binding protein subunit alpha, other, partial [Exophiala aquamarina CBS 119918]
IHSFENINTILFLVAPSEYYQLLFDCETIRRMEDALYLSNNICHPHWFIKTSILFLNKIN